MYKIDLKKDRYVAKCIIALVMLKNNINKHLDVWENEIKENDGYLSPYIHNLVLKNVKNKVNSMKDELDYIISDNMSEENLQKLTHSTFNSLSNVIQRQALDMDNGVEMNVEAATLPKDFLFTFCNAMYLIEYLTKDLEPTLIKLDIKNKLNKIKSLFSRYEKFVENDILCTNGFTTLEAYNNFKNNLMEV